MKLRVFGSGFGLRILELRSGSNVSTVETSTLWQGRTGTSLGGLTGINKE